MSDDLRARAEQFLKSWKDVFVYQRPAEWVLDSMAAFAAEVSAARVQAALKEQEPSKSWRCWHCDEVFTDAASASDHFGKTENWGVGKAVCQMSIRDIRGLEDEVTALKAENERLDNDARLWHESEADRVCRIGNVQWWQRLDSEEGEKLAWKERAEQAEADLAALQARVTRIQTEFKDALPYRNSDIYEQVKWLVEQSAYEAEIIADCAAYLKDDETPAECIERNRKDIDALMTVYAQRTQERDDLQARYDAVVAELANVREHYRVLDAARIEATVVEYDGRRKAEAERDAANKRHADYIRAVHAPRIGGADL